MLGLKLNHVSKKGALVYIYGDDIDHENKM